MDVTQSEPSSELSVAKSESKKTIEIIGPWLLNKGDVLNLNALHQQLGELCNLSVSSALGLPKLPAEPHLYRVKWRPTLAEVGKSFRHPKVHHGLSLLRRSIGLRFASQRSLLRRNIVDGNKLSGLIDCSGFAYGDSWNPKRILGRAKYYRFLEKRGVTLVLVPQAFGPFSDPTIREAVTAALRPFHRIFARDQRSYEHLSTLDIDTSRIAIAPDVTHLVKGDAIDQSDDWTKTVCFVPNARMLDRTSLKSDRSYQRFVLYCIGETEKRGLKACFVVHEKNDRPLIDELQSELPKPIPIIDENALKTKGYLGACYAVIGSRYHALLSSLSQGTPSLGTSWNHKYEALFRDYASPDLVITPDCDRQTVNASLEKILDTRKNAILKAELANIAEAQKQRVRSMWTEVKALLGIRSN